MAKRASWGTVGNKLRKKKLSKSRRSEIAKIAADARWKSKRRRPSEKSPAK